MGGFSNQLALQGVTCGSDLIPIHVVCFGTGADFCEFDHKIARVFFNISVLCQIVQIIWSTD